MENDPGCDYLAGGGEGPLLKKIVALLWEKTVNLERIQETYEEELRNLKERVALLSNSQEIYHCEREEIGEGLAKIGETLAGEKGTRESSANQCLTPDTGQEVDSINSALSIEGIAVEEEEVFSESSLDLSVSVGAVRPVLMSGLSYDTSTFHEDSSAGEDSAAPVPTMKRKAVVSVTDSPGAKMPVLLRHTDSEERSDESVVEEQQQHCETLQSEESLGEVTPTRQNSTPLLADEASLVVIEEISPKIAENTPKLTESEEISPKLTEDTSPNSPEETSANKTEQIPTKLVEPAAEGTSVSLPPELMEDTSPKPGEVPESHSAEASHVDQDPEIASSNVPEPTIASSKVLEPEIASTKVPEPEIVPSKVPEPEIASSKILEPEIASSKVLEPEIVPEEASAHLAKDALLLLAEDASSEIAEEITPQPTMSMLALPGESSPEVSVEPEQNSKWKVPWERSDTFDVLPAGTEHPATVPAKPLRRVTPGNIIIGAGNGGTTASNGGTTTGTDQSGGNTVLRESSSENRSSTFSLASYSSVSSDYETQYITPQETESEQGGVA